MAIRFAPKTDEDLKAKAVAPTPAIDDAPVSEVAAPVKPVKASKTKAKDRARDAAESKGE